MGSRPSSTPQAPPRFLSLDRAARIVAPISDDIEGHYLRGGIVRVLHMLGEFDIDVEAQGEPPLPPYEVPTRPLTRQWFAAARHKGGAEWHRALLEWSRACLKVSRQGIVANLSPPSGQYHAPVSDVDAAGASWSFPQALAWIATRDPLEVARMQYGQHFGPPMDNAEPGLRAMLQSDGGRRRLIGWLVVRTSLDHCTCGSALIADQEPWETCQCVGRAYDDLRGFAKGSPHPIPEYQPSPSHASFTLTWPDGAHLLRFARAEILERWQLAPTNTSTAAGERDCAAWLDQAMSADRSRQRKKASFRDEALKLFAGRVTLTGFNQRIWPEVARKHDRSKPGASRKS